jgi:hypothetical protein
MASQDDHSSASSFTRRVTGPAAIDEITFALIPSDDFGEIIDNASAKVAGSWLIKVDGTWNVPTTL